MNMKRSHLIARIASYVFNVKRVTFKHLTTLDGNHLSCNMRPNGLEMKIDSNDITFIELSDKTLEEIVKRINNLSL